MSTGHRQQRPTAEEWHQVAYALAGETPRPKPAAPVSNSNPKPAKPQPAPPGSQQPTQAPAPEISALRLSRTWYWIAVVAIIPLALAVAAMMRPSPNPTLLEDPLIRIFLMMYLPIAILRARDMGYNWFASVALSVVAGALFLPLLLLLLGIAKSKTTIDKLNSTKVFLIGIAAFFAIMAVIIVVSITMVSEPSGRTPTNNAPTTPQTNARQPSATATATAYCDDLLVQMTEISATAMYYPDDFRATMDIVAAQNDDWPNNLGPDDVLFAGLAANEILTNEDNANKVIDWIQFRKPSECPPDVWNPWVTRIQHEGHGKFTVSFVGVGNQRGFPVTPANQMVFIPETAQGELPTTLAPTATPTPTGTPEPTERPTWDTISLRTVTGRLVDGLQEPTDVIAVIQTHDGIQHCRMEIQDEAWQEVSIGDTLTVQGIHVDVSEDKIPLLDLCTVIAWAPQP